MPLNTVFTKIKMINPFILASAPPTATRSMIERAFQAGWGGAVIKTLAQQEPDRLTNVTPRIQAVRHKNSVGGFVNMELGSMRGIHDWLEDIAAIKRGFPDRALIASILYGGSPLEDQWREAARLSQQAGADGLELNVSCPHGSAEEGGMSSIANHPDILRKVIEWARSESTLPVWVKLPVSCDLDAAALIAKKAGADAITVINTISALAGIDVETDSPLPSVDGHGSLGGLSGRAIKPVTLRCIVQLRQTSGLPVCGVGGLYDWRDTAEAILAGAGCVQICSAVMEHGYGIIDELCAGLSEWMDRRGFASLNEAVGRTAQRVLPHRSLDRDFVVRPVLREQSCVRCGKCEVCCRDSGFQAISRVDGYPKINMSACDGCGLCAGICPTASLRLDRQPKT